MVQCPSLCLSQHGPTAANLLLYVARGRWRCSNGCAPPAFKWNRLPHHIRALQSIDSFKVAPKTYLFDCLWLNTAETVWQSSTAWLTRALVTSLTCYGALEIVGLLLLLSYICCCGLNQQEISVDCCTAHSSMAGECGQCHIVSIHRKLNRLVLHTA